MSREHVPLRSTPHARRSTPDAPRTTLRMPAEWERHAATWIAWPHHEPDWPGKLEPIQWVYAEIVRVLHWHERVEILCRDETGGDQTRIAVAAQRVETTRECDHGERSTTR